MEPGTDNDSLREVREIVEQTSRHYYHTPQQQGIDNRTKRFVIERCLPYINGPRVLELGYIDGIWTDLLVARGFSVDIVEGAKRHAEHARERYRENEKVTVNQQLFQELKPACSYNTILAADILQYIPDVVEFLRNCQGWLDDNGVLIVTVPNSRSMHRRIGALMGMEPLPTVQNKRDMEVGNLRSYDRYELRYALMEAGYDIHAIRGCFFKPLSSAQMETWSDELLRAFLDVGDELEDYCWVLYAVCTKSRG